MKRTKVNILLRQELGRKKLDTKRFCEFCGEKTIFNYVVSIGHSRCSICGKDSRIFSNAEIKDD